MMVNLPQQQVIIAIKLIQHCYLAKCQLPRSLPIAALKYHLSISELGVIPTIRYHKCVTEKLSIVFNNTPLPTLTKFLQVIRKIQKLGITLNVHANIPRRVGGNQRLQGRGLPFSPQ